MSTRHQSVFRMFLVRQDSLCSRYIQRNVLYESVCITAALKMLLLGQDLYYVRCHNTGQKDYVPLELTDVQSKGQEAQTEGLVHGNTEMTLFTVITSCQSAPWLFIFRGLDGVQQGTMKEVFECSSQAHVATFPAPHGRGPLSQGASCPASPTVCANIPSTGNMLSY